MCVVQEGEYADAMGMKMKRPKMNGFRLLCFRRRRLRKVGSFVQCCKQWEENRGEGAFACASATLPWPVL